jgi:hypothetical protein
MPFKVIITDIAERNVADLYDWYSNIDFNLGLKFIYEYKKALHRVSSNPTHYSFIAPNLRRCSFNKMHCMIIYKVNINIIQILSIKDTRSKPNETFY